MLVVLTSPHPAPRPLTPHSALAANPPPTANPPQAGAVQTAATNKRRNGPTTRRHTGQTGRQLHLKDPPPHTASPIVGPQMDIYDDFFCQMLHLPNHPTDAKYLSEKSTQNQNRNVQSSLNCGQNSLIGLSQSHLLHPHNLCNTYSQMRSFFSNKALLELVQLLFTLT